MGKKKVSNFLYEGESYKVRGCCFNVYNILGGGIREKVIELALDKEFRSRGLSTQTQARIEVMYKGERVGTYVPDFVIESKIVLELKSKPFLTVADKKQFWSYLKGSPYQLGFLVNFGPQRLTIERFAHSKSS